jgi:peptide/nickel transport system permease protein
VLFFVGRRLLAGVGMLIVVSILIFIGTRVLPGDAAVAILGRNANPRAVSALRLQLGLNRPAVIQYRDWLWGFVRGDLGFSVTAQRSIWPYIKDAVANSAILASVTVAVLVPVSLALGVLAAARAGRLWDNVVSVSTLAFIALPEFVTGTILMLVFAITLRVLPAVSFVSPGESPLRTPNVLVLPCLTLLAASIAATVRMVRANTIEALRSEYVAVARLNGYPERRVVLRFALRNALAPTVQVIALNIQWLVGGIVVTEYVFGYPGIGQLLVQAVAARDIPLVQSVAMLVAAFYFVINILADLLIVFLIPKLRTSL